MITCSISKNFNGIDGVMNDEEYNDMVCAIDTLLENKDLSPVFHDRFKMLRYKLLNLSLFDEAKGLVHVRLGMRELMLYTEALRMYLPDYQRSYYEEVLHNGDHKTWRSGGSEV